MLSFDGHASLIDKARWLSFVVSALLLAGGVCCAPGALASGSAVECVTPERLSASAPVAQLRRSVEATSLFTVPAAASQLTDCRIDQVSDTTSIDYVFADGTSLSVRRDASIEQTDL